jgi:hypothetical protein
MTKISTADALSLVKSWSDENRPIGVGAMYAGFGLFMGGLFVDLAMDTGVVLTHGKPGAEAAQLMLDFAKVRIAFLATRDEIGKEGI